MRRIIRSGAVPVRAELVICMSKSEPLRMRLARTKTIHEIEALISEIENDPDSRIGATGINLYNAKAIKKMDEMTWAVYTIAKRERGN